MKSRSDELSLEKKGQTPCRSRPDVDILQSLALPQEKTPAGHKSSHRCHYTQNKYFENLSTFSTPQNNKNQYYQL